MKTAILFACLLALPLSAAADKLGQILQPLSFTTEPDNFHYAANGKKQAIMIYPAAPVAMKSTDVHQLLMDQGHDPLTVVDIKHKAWFTPTAMVEKELRQQSNEEHRRPASTVSGDYHAQALDAWDLDVGINTIIVDGKGRITFFKQGILNAADIQQVLHLMNT